MRHFLGIIPAVLLTIPFSAQADTVLPGTEIAVSTDRPIHVTQWDRGRIYQGRVARDVVARDGDVAIPAGSPVELIVRETGPNQMMIDVESVTVRGRRYVMDTSGPEFNTGAYNNGNAVVGAILGAIAGANGEDVITRGSEIRIPADAVLRFRLEEPLHLVGWQDPGYENNGYHYHHEQDWYR